MKGFFCHTAEVYNHVYSLQACYNDRIGKFWNGTGASVFLYSTSTIEVSITKYPPREKSEFEQCNLSKFGHFEETCPNPEYRQNLSMDLQPNQEFNALRLHLTILCLILDLDKPVSPVIDYHQTGRFIKYVFYKQCKDNYFAVSNKIFS
jgi:hypothetical protein